MTAAGRRTRARTKTGKRVVFRGPPHHLSAIVLLADLGAEAEEVRGIEGGLEGAEVRSLRARAMQREEVPAARMTMRLATSTPPGTYGGSARIGERAVPIVAEVEQRARLRAEPSRFVIEASPGSEAAMDVLLLCAGNAPVPVPESGTFCVFDGRGIDHAFWAALASDPPEGRQRIDVLLDDLSRFHGGLVDVRVTRGAGEIGPGEAREVGLAMRFSDRIRPGRTYAGAWEVGAARVRVRLTVPERADGKTTRARR